MSNGNSDIVMSDMAINTTGIKNIDSIQTGELCKAMIFSKKLSQLKVFLFQNIYEDHLMKLFSLEKAI